MTVSDARQSISGHGSRSAGAAGRVVGVGGNVVGAALISSPFSGFGDGEVVQSGARVMRGSSLHVGLAGGGGQGLLHFGQKRGQELVNRIRPRTRGYPGGGPRFGPDNVQFV